MYQEMFSKTRHVTLNVVSVLSTISVIAVVKNVAPGEPRVIDVYTYYRYWAKSNKALCMVQFLFDHTILFFNYLVTSV